MLKRVTYASRSRLGGDIEELRKLRAESETFNSKHSITGVLYYGRGTFFQSLEGSKEAVADLYQRIKLDARHTEVTLLEFAEVDRKLYADWPMKYVPGDLSPPPTLSLSFSAIKSSSPEKLHQILVFLRSK